jgi:hypothetical protein
MDLPIPLAEVFTAAGVVTWAAALAGVVELLKRAVPFIPEHGRGVLYVVMGLSWLLIAAAALDIGLTLTPATIVGLILTWAALVTAASGSYEIAAKGGRILQGTTNPVGPDETITAGPASG